MIIDYYTIGTIYWDFCVYDRPIDLNRYAENIFDTCAYLMDIKDFDEIEGSGHAHSLYAMQEIFNKLININKSYYMEKYPVLFKVVPEENMKAVIYKSRLINKSLIDEGVTPSDLFEKPRTGGVDYWQ